MRLLIRHCQTHADRKHCVDLQRRIWGYEPADLVPAAMFAVAQHSGGHAMCAFDGASPIGFALTYSAREHGHYYWHSHMVGVLPEYQSQGVGRLLKLKQREEALKQDIACIRWTFDPLEPRNAWFNLTRLGAIIRHYIPNCYGETTSRLHGGLPTDRFVAEWRLRSPRVERAIDNQPLIPATGTLEIPLPANIADLKQAAPDRAREIQSELQRNMLARLASGYAVTGFRRGPQTNYFLLEPYED